jgi:FkbM family methyltransferase
MNKLIKKIINLIIAIIIKIKKRNYSYTSLGSVYGEWTFHNKISPNPTVLSCGAGEDISFDIDFLNHFFGKIYLIDPTPRAIKHYNLVKKKFGNKKKINYMFGGKQSIDSYNLKKINSNNLKLIKKAVWIKNKKLKFYEPKDKNHVSFSLNKNINSNGKFIEVEGIDILSIIDKYNIKDIEIIKLDVEGAELIIIEDLFNKNIFPRQILFEFDQLKENSLKSIIYLFKFFKLINKFKYDLFYNDIKNNFSIIKKIN